MYQPTSQLFLVRTICLGHVALGRRRNLVRKPANPDSRVGSGVTSGGQISSVNRCGYWRLATSNPRHNASQSYFRSSLLPRFLGQLRRRINRSPRTHHVPMELGHVFAPSPGGYGEPWFGDLSAGHSPGVSFLLNRGFSSALAAAEGDRLASTLAHGSCKGNRGSTLL